jgi:hypothetical protein
MASQTQKRQYKLRKPQNPVNKQQSSLAGPGDARSSVLRFPVF